MSGHALSSSFWNRSSTLRSTHASESIKRHLQEEMLTFTARAAMAGKGALRNGNRIGFPIAFHIQKKVDK
jgi:hypothetical protein